MYPGGRTGSLQQACYRGIGVSSLSRDKPPTIYRALWVSHVDQEIREGEMTRLAGQNLTSSKSVALEALLAFVVTVRCESELPSASWVIKSPRLSGGHRDYDGRIIISHGAYWLT